MTAERTHRVQSRSKIVSFPQIDAERNVMSLSDKINNNLSRDRLLHTLKSTECDLREQVCRNGALYYCSNRVLSLGFRILFDHSIGNQAIDQWMVKLEILT